jgi:protein PhnA
MTTLPNCPQCHSAYTYEDGALYVCPECAHEWSQESPAATEETRVVRDAVGNVLQDGDSVTVIKDLKVKGSSAVIKRGTLIKGIHLTDNDEEIECRHEKVKGLVLKTCFTRKA